MTVVSDLRQRMLDDLLESERQFRELAERKARALVGVLSELAYQLDGSRLEQLRQMDPNAPQSWKPEDWCAFFRGIPARGDGWGDKATRVVELEQELARLKSTPPAPLPVISEPPPAIAAVVEVPPQPRASAKAATMPNPAGYAGLIEAISALEPPPSLPNSFRFSFDPSMSKADAALAFKRRLLTLRVLAHGLSVMVEVGRLVGAASNSDARSGSLRRAFDALERDGLIARQTLCMPVISNLPTRLVVARLSEDGIRLCQALGWQAVESEWERLLRLHEGERQEAHTLSILLFAASARLRGWSAEILPEVSGPARPDLRIARGDPSWLVEVETGAREHDQNAKWRNLAALQDGRVGIVARNTVERRALIADCRNIAQHGAATDIETLILAKFGDLSPADPLWAEEW